MLHHQRQQRSLLEPAVFVNRRLFVSMHKNIMVKIDYKEKKRFVNKKIKSLN